MAKAGYSITTGGLVALSASTPKSILGVAGPASFGVDLTHYEVAFDGVSVTAAPVLVEVCYATFATNAPGTASTSVTVNQAYGRSITAGFAAAKTWTTEPTVLTVIREHSLTPFGGTEVYDFPLGTSPDSAVSQGFVIRCTAPTGVTVNVRATMAFERC